MANAQSNASEQQLHGSHVRVLLHLLCLAMVAAAGAAGDVLLPVAAVVVGGAHWLVLRPVLDQVTAGCLLLGRAHVCVLQCLLMMMKHHCAAAGGMQHLELQQQGAKEANSCSDGIQQQTLTWQQHSALRAADQGCRIAATSWIGIDMLQ